MPVHDVLVNGSASIFVLAVELSHSNVRLMRNSTSQSPVVDTTRDRLLAWIEIATPVIAEVPARRIEPAVLPTAELLSKTRCTKLTLTSSPRRAQPKIIDNTVPSFMVTVRLTLTSRPPLSTRLCGSNSQSHAEPFPFFT